MEKKAFPQGVWVVFFVLTLLMIGSASLQGATVLYLTKQLNFTDKHAYSLFAAYHSLVYTACILGGFLGTRFLTQSSAVLSGLILGCAAFLSLLIPGQIFLYIGLSLSALSVGLVTPNIYDLLGKLYQKGDPARDSAFTMAYTGMNLGALVGFMSAGFITEYFGYSFVFLISAVAFFIASVFFMVNTRLFLQDKPLSFRPRNFTGAFVIITLAAFSIFGMLHISFFSRSLVIIVGIFILLAISVLACRYYKTDRIKSYKLIIFIFLSLISIIFWALYMLQSTMLVIFIDRNVHRELAGLLIPAASILGFNPFIMLILGPLLSFWWLHRSKQNKLTATSSKFAAGIFAIGLAFACLAIGIKFADLNGYNNLIWTGLFFLFISIGEIIIAPAGYAMIGLLLEDNLHSVALGIWQLMLGVGTALSGDLAQLTSVPKAATLPLQVTNKLYFTNFTLFALASIVVGICALGLVKFQRKVGI